MQGWLNIQKWFTIHHINKKNPLIMSIDGENESDKNSTSTNDNSQQTRYRKELLHLIMGIYEKLHS